MSFVRGAVSRICSSSFLPLRRHYSVRSSSSLSSFSVPRGFEWRKLVSPHTSPEAIETFKSIESSVAKLSNDVASTPAAPAAIDWNKWTKTIKTPGAVAELKKQYEATLSSISSAEAASTAKKPVEIEEFNAEFDKIISKAESIAKVSQEEANKLKESLKFLEDIELAIAHGNLSEPAAALLTNPGLKERLLEEYENGEFAPTEAELRVYNMDVNAIRNVIVNGGDIDVGGLVPADRFGEFKPTAIPQEVKEWEKKIYGDLAKGEDTVNWEFETDPYADEKSDDHH